LTKVDGEDWIVMKSRDSCYGVQDGDVFVWMESFCSRMVKGLGPTFAPESDKVLAYAQAEIGRKIPIQAYMGFPLYR
ncbi:MAG: sensor domain-containing diguanylate cyclase, partial [Armatimonadota bacterium]